MCGLHILSFLWPGLWHCKYCHILVTMLLLLHSRQIRHYNETRQGCAAEGRHGTQRSKSWVGLNFSSHRFQSPAASKMNEEHSAFATGQDLANASYWQTGLLGSRYPAQYSKQWLSCCAICCVCMCVSVYVCVTLPSRSFKNANSRGAAGKRCS